MWKSVKEWIGSSRRIEKEKERRKDLNENESLVFFFFSLFIFNEYPFDGMFEFVFKIQVMEAADNYLNLEAVRHVLNKERRRFDDLVSL